MSFILCFVHCLNLAALYGGGGKTKGVAILEPLHHHVDVVFQNKSNINNLEAFYLVISVTLGVLYFYFLLGWAATGWLAIGLVRVSWRDLP